MRAFLSLALLGLLAFPGMARAQLEVDKNEILRIGELEQFIDPENPISADPMKEAFVMAMALPDDDADAWELVAVGQKKCPACDRLKQDLQRQPLSAYIEKDAVRKTPWAHFTWYDYHDKTQSWRWDPKNEHAFRITHLPTLILMPPRSRIYGDPAVVVWQYIYGGDDADPDKCSKDLNATVKRYLAYLNSRGALPEQKATPGVSALGSFQEWQPGSGGGMFNIAPEKVALYARSAGEQTLLAQAPPSPVPDGRQYPPLDIPHEPKPDQSRPVIDAFLNRAHGEIVVVRNKNEFPDEQTEAQIKATVEELQPADKPLKVSQLYVEDNPWGIKADETPVVLKVRGEDVLEKLAVEPDAPKGFASLIIIPILMAIFGTYSTAMTIWNVLKVMLVIFCVMAFLLFVVMMALMLRPRQAAAPPAPQGFTSEQLAQFAAAGATPKPPAKPAE